MVSSAAAASGLSSDVLRAEHFDLLGRHAEAIDSLVAGVRRNDVEALTRLGKRLLIGDRAPQLPGDALRFLADAQDRGGAEAAAILAVCYATGVPGPPDLSAACASLVLAAERGWTLAQAQLQVLVGDPSWRQSSPALAAPGHWQRLAQRIELAAWQSVPAAVDLHGSPLLRTYPLFIEPEVRGWIIQRAKGRLTPALVYDAGNRQTTTHSTRTNTWTVFNLLETDLVCVLVQWRMAACLGVPFRHLEAMTVLHYDIGEQISEHFDFVDPNIPNYAEQVRERGQRIVTFLVYLNDDYTGGQTDFPRLGVSHQGVAGEGFFFVNAFADGSPDVRTLHAGRAPATGEKWIISQFIKNQPAF
jgi:hypothetical protein